MGFVAAYIAAALVMFGVPALAWRWGGPAERWGALMNSLLTLSIAVSQLATGEARPGLAFLTGDFLLASGFLVLALRYSNVWLGAAMLLQSAELTLNAVTLSAGREPAALDAIATNLISLAVVSTILAGAWTHRQRERRKIASL